MDLCLYRPGYGAIYIGRSNGDGTFTQVYASHSGIVEYNLGESSDKVFSLNYDGNSNSDLCLYRPGGGIICIAKSVGLVPDLLTDINNEYQGATHIVYQCAPQVLGAINSSKSQYPNIAINAACILVTRISVDNGFTGDQHRKINTCYQYSNGLLHRGLPDNYYNLGFEWMEKTDENTGSSVKTYYHQDDIDLRWLVKKEETYGSDRKLYLVKEYRYAKELIKDNSSSPEWHDVKFIYKTDDYLYNYNGEEAPRLNIGSSTNTIPLKETWLRQLTTVILP